MSADPRSRKGWVALLHVHGGPAGGGARSSSTTHMALVETASAPPSAAQDIIARACHPRKAAPRVTHSPAEPADTAT